MERSERATKGLTMDRIRSGIDREEARVLSPYAIRSKDGVRRSISVPDTDYRQSFSIDTDRILHSLAYTRYIDKTQVFYLVSNDHITHRVLHVQLVSKIARTIGRFLGLNPDLIEAIALGHDIGHTPFGHDGERFLSRLCLESGIGHFHHNLQSVQFLDKVERRGAGWNLCLQTLDGILCHDGEVHDRALLPDRDKTFATLEKEIDRKKKDGKARVIPMSLEGCVVRLADTVAYIGRDIEDAIRLNLIKRRDLPAQCCRILGETNGEIVYTLVTDIIHHSYQQPHVGFSREISEALFRLKQFNLERIYMNPKVKTHMQRIEQLFELQFNRYCEEIQKADRSSAIFSDFLQEKSEAYLGAHQTEEIVRDYIAGMTDRYFLRQCPKEMRPAELNI